jgi:hypothetical protein
MSDGCCSYAKPGSQCDQSLPRKRKWHTSVNLRTDGANVFMKMSILLRSRVVLKREGDCWILWDWIGNYDSASEHSSSPIEACLSRHERLQTSASRCQGLRRMPNPTTVVREPWRRFRCNHICYVLILTHTFSPPQTIPVA